MNDEKLKPCSSCGGEAEIVDFPITYAVECKKCCATIDGCYSEKDAIQSWNKRTE